MLTSPRRFLSRGVMTQLLLDMLILSCDSVGIAPHRIWDGYQNWNRIGGKTKRRERERSAG